MSKSLSTDRLFVVCFWGGILLGLTSFIMIIRNNELIWCYELDCFNNAVEIFKLPINTIASGMALAAFRAMVFRSYQTKIQIDEANKQNIFKNYIDHKKEFISTLDLLEESLSVVIKQRPYLYKNIFPENSPTSIKFDSQELDSDKSWLDFRLNEYNKLVEEYNTLASKSIPGVSTVSEKDFARWLLDYIFLIFKLDIVIPDCKPISKTYKRLFSDSDEINMVPPNIEKSSYIVSEYFRHLMDFSLPSRSERIKIYNLLSYGGRMDEKFSVFTDLKA